MNYYIDGNFRSFSSPKGGSVYHSSAYSNCKSPFVAIELSSEQQQKIKKESFIRIASFYNKNEALFHSFRDKVGVNVWFFEHFRLTFLFQNFQLKIAVLKQFLSEFPEGKVISSDNNIRAFIPSKSIQIEDEIKTRKKETSMFKELGYILSQWRPVYRQKNEGLILSVWQDNVDGKDKRFGALEFEMDKLFNRETFNPKNKLPEKKSEYKKAVNVDQLMARYLLSYKSSFQILKFGRELKKLYQRLYSLNNNELAESGVILNYFKAAQLSMFVYFLRYCSFKKFFRKTKYRTIMFINENSPQQKAVQYAAYQEGVKTLAIQHGAIYPSHPAYIYKHYQTKPLLPDFTFVWGEHYRAILTDHGGYSPEQVITSGRIPPLNPVRRRHPELNKVRKCIIYATQPQPDENLRKRELKAVLNAVKSNKQSYDLVLRPHPAELEDDFFLEIAKETGFHEFLIDRTSDLTTHFEVADIFITSYSTVGAEFVPYYKPLVILDFLKIDMVNYIRLGVGIPIYKEPDLINLLKEDLLKVNEAAHLHFTNDYFYKNGEEAVNILRETIRTHFKQNNPN